AADNDCSFVGPNAEPALFDAAQKLGVTRCIIADYDCLNKACGNALSVEISLDSPQNDPEYWYDRLLRLDAPGKPQPLQRYRYRRRVTWAEKEALGLCDWRAFRPISDAQAKKL